MTRVAIRIPSLPHSRTNFSKFLIFFPVNRLSLSHLGIAIPVLCRFLDLFKFTPKNTPNSVINTKMMMMMISTVINVNNNHHNFDINLLTKITSLAYYTENISNYQKKNTNEKSSIIFFFDI